MILLMEMVFAIIVLAIISDCIQNVNRQIQTRLLQRDLVRNYTPEQIDEFCKSVGGIRNETNKIKK